jgi:hypothetical protein
MSIEDRGQLHDDERKTRFQLIRSKRATALHQLSKQALVVPDGDRQFEGLVFKAMHGHEGHWSNDFSDDTWRRRDPEDDCAFDSPPAYLDDFAATLAIVPEGAIVSRLDQSSQDLSWTSYVVRPGQGGGSANARTAVRALLSAALACAAAFDGVPA